MIKLLGLILAGGLIMFLVFNNRFTKNESENLSELITPLGDVKPSVNPSSDENDQSIDSLLEATVQNA